MKKVLTWLAIIIAVLRVIKRPDQAVTLAHQVAHAISAMAASL